MSRTSLIMAAAPPKSLVLVMTALFVWPICLTLQHGLQGIVPEGIRLDLIHVDNGGNLTKLELLQRAIERGKHKLETLKMPSMLSPSPVYVQRNDYSGAAVVNAGAGEFIVHLWMGTPSMAFQAVLDTGGSLIWTRCTPCANCPQQPSSFFNPSHSSSYLNVPCNSAACKALSGSACLSNCMYLFDNGNSSRTEAVLASETFSFSPSPERVPVPGIAFACGYNNQGVFNQVPGILGLGRGPLSLVSQLGLNRFSYCLTPIDSISNGALFLGSAAYINKKLQNQIGATPLLYSPSPRTQSYYYISWEGISVGGSHLRIPESTFALKDDGTGGMIIDTGTLFTYLEAATYKLFRETFVSKMKLPEATGRPPNGFDLCFESRSAPSDVDVPNVAFFFTGAEMVVPQTNFLFHDPSSGLLCVTIMESVGVSVLGSLFVEVIFVEKHCVGFWLSEPFPTYLLAFCCHS